MEAVVQASSAQFLDATIDQLKSLREALARAAADTASRSQVHEHIREEAFQIKGMGVVFGYPLLNEFSKSPTHFLKQITDLHELQQAIASINVYTFYMSVTHQIAAQ